jgi:hypothetical protein
VVIILATIISQIQRSTLFSNLYGECNTKYKFKGESSISRICGQFHFFFFILIIMSFETKCVIIQNQVICIDMWLFKNVDYLSLLFWHRTNLKHLLYSVVDPNSFFSDSDPQIFFFRFGFGYGCGFLD